MDDLTRLLDLPAAARLSVADGELALVTLTHEHEDKLVIERRRLGASIDLGDLFQLVGAHGLAPAVQLQVTEVAALPAPREPLPAPVESRPALPGPEGTPGNPPTARRSTKHADRPPPARVPCSKCGRTFGTQHALEVHTGFAHRDAPPTPVACPQCGQMCVSGSGLGIHIARRHGRPPSTPLVSPATSSAAGDDLEARFHRGKPAPGTVEVAPAVSSGDKRGTCNLCGHSWRQHPQCSDCGCLLGEGHAGGTGTRYLAKELHCATCRARRDREKAYGHRPGAPA